MPLPPVHCGRLLLALALFSIGLGCGGLPSWSGGPSPTARKGPLDVPTLNARRGKLVGKVVTVHGYIHGLTRQGRPATQVNVSVGVSPEVGSESVLCISPPSTEADFHILQGEPITVHGRVSEDSFFESAMLENCRIGGAKPRRKSR